jgi:UDP:flavonoid glycosyltransferase YjiC (YdhE family)
VTLSNAYATPYFDPARLLVSPEQAPLKYHLTRYLMRPLVALQARHLAPGLRAVARRQGLRDRRSLFDFFRGDLNLLADPPGFVPVRDLPRTFQYIGPLIWEGMYPARHELPPLYPGQKRVYATIGNTGDPRLLQAAVDAFAGRPEFQLILTTGAYHNPTIYRGPDNVYADRFLPGSAVMRQSDLVIHSGGNGTTYQCLVNGCPAIVVPANNEQIVAARLVRYHRVGVPLSLRDLTASRLQDLSLRLLQDMACRRRVQGYQRSFGEMAAPSAAASAVLSVIAPTAAAGKTSHRICAKRHVMGKENRVPA